jgi:hypothetical protein
MWANHIHLTKQRLTINMSRPTKWKSHLPNDSVFEKVRPLNQIDSNTFMGENYYPYECKMEKSLSLFHI